MRSKVVPQTKETVISNSSGLWPSHTPPISFKREPGTKARNGLGSSTTNHNRHITANLTH